jgi:hemerythrin-like domain-containing protein
MESIRELIREHKAIKGLLERFSRLLDRAEHTVEVDAEPVVRMLSFFEHEVDGFHQQKEERVLLRRLRQQARGDDLVCVHATFREHVEGHRLLLAMRSNVEGACYGEPGCIADLIRDSRRYLVGQAAHACWEEKVLFGQARRILDPSDDLQVVRAFHALDEERGDTVTGAATKLAEWLDRETPLLAA